MGYGKSIELFLANGTADSLIIAELSNWNGKAIKIPRIEVADCKRDDIKEPGIYFLFCKEEDNTEYKNDLQKSYASNELINLVSLLENANEEANKLFKNIFERNLTIKSLEQQITLKEREINEVKLQIRNEKDKSTYLTTKIEELKAELNSSNLEIDNLKGRLKIAFNIDDVKKNQEIITLKTDISTALKLQYEDFNEHKEEECNEDNYEALKVTLNQVFRTLKRYGIDF